MAEVSVGNFLYAYHTPQRNSGLTNEYNRYVAGFRPVQGSGLLLRLADGDKMNFVKALVGTDASSEKDKDALGWNYREIYTAPITDNWMEHYNAGKEFDAFTSRESSELRKRYGGKDIGDDVVEDIINEYAEKSSDLLWSHIASHVISQELIAAYQNSGRLSLDDFENTLSIAKASCNGTPKKAMFNLSSKLRSPADLTVMKSFVKSDSFANHKPTLGTRGGKTKSSAPTKIVEELIDSVNNEDEVGAYINLSRVGCVREGSDAFLNDYLKAKNSIKGGFTDTSHGTNEMDSGDDEEETSDDETESKLKL
jgi:hypothetical protein